MNELMTSLDFCKTKFKYLQSGCLYEFVAENGGNKYLFQHDIHIEVQLPNPLQKPPEIN